MGGGGGGGVLGGVNNFLFGDGGADAAQKAALAQQSAANAAYQETKGIVNPATVAGLASFDQSIAQQDKNLSRQEQLISQLDPTIIEASQQALKLLRGEKSQTLGPLEQQRATQREKLISSLREQLGPGAETSTAGIQALNKFDSETSQIMNGAQQSALSLLGGVSGQFSAQRPDMAREISALSAFNQGKTDLQFRQAQALSNARQGVTQNAGAQYTGDVIQGQSNASFGKSLFGGLTTVGAAYALGDPTKSTRIGSWFGGGTA
jgi:hypothetical protein